MVSPLFNHDEACAHLQMLALLGQIHLALISQDGGSVMAHDFGVEAEPSLRWIEQYNLQGYNAYWSVNRVRSGHHAKASKADIEAARCLHVDIDPPKGGGALDKNATLQRLLAFEHGAPSFVIDSGNGLQAFWRLQPGCDLTEVELT